VTPGYTAKRTMDRPSPPPVRLPRLLAGLVVAAMVSAGCTAVADLQEERLDVQPLAQTSRIFDSRGELITPLHAEEDRVIVPLKDIPRVAQNAVIAIEDQRFWQHRGVDVKAILRAAYVNATTGRIEEGGSTITQQYVKQRMLTDEQTFSRKLREASLAWQLEEELSKEQILTRYMNTVYFGQGAYGIQRGAQTFFSKHAAELTLSESALLAGLIAGPNRWSPVDRPTAAVARRNLVLGQMHELGMIDEEDFAQATSAPLRLRPRLGARRYPAPWFVDYVKHQILTSPRFGDTYRQRYDLLFRGGLRIYTTIDLRMQRAAEAALHGILAYETDPYGALTAVDPRTGFIKAMVGGRDYWVGAREDRFAKLNLAIGGSTGRQAGSSFKPFALIAALENGIPPTRTYAAPSTMVLHDPPCGSDDLPWQVRNYDGASYGGSMTMDQGLVSSINVVYAQIIRDVHPERVVDVAHRMGIRSRLRPFCSAVLGSNEVNTLEMASAFGTVSTLGMHVRPTAIERIEDARGNVLYEADPVPRQVLNQDVAAAALEIMKKVILSGTGTAANLGRPAAGKTGTAQEWRDAWFAGFVPQLSAAVWVGFPQGQIAMTSTRIGTVTGGSWPAQIWHAFMSQVVQRMPVKEFKEPRQEYVAVPVDITRGCRATSSTPSAHVRQIRFVPGTEPATGCEYSDGSFVDGEETRAAAPTVEGVPTVIGLAVESAVKVLKDQGYRVHRERERIAGYPRGTVIVQSPVPGVPADTGATVTITVAR
jgi:penicillin-binding protein 1A